MSFLDAVLSDTIGVGYRAVTGNVDPWTKQQQIDQLSSDLQTASGGAMSESDAIALAGSTITDALVTAPGGGADPSQSTGLRIPGLGVFGSADFLSNINNITHAAIAIGILIAGVYGFQVFGRPLARAFRRR